MARTLGSRPRAHLSVAAARAADSRRQRRASRWWGAPIAALLSLAPLPAAAALPGTLGYAGFLSDDSGPVDGAVNIRVSLYASPTPDSGESALWTEYHQDVPVTTGAFALSLGSQTRLDPALLDANGELWLEFVVDGDALSPRTALESVPFAWRSSVSDSSLALEGFDPADFQYALDVACGEGRFLRDVLPDGSFVCGDDRTLTPDEVRTILADSDLVHVGDPISWWDLEDVPEGFADGVDDVGEVDEATVDLYVANNGYLTSVPPADWAELRNVPAGFADGTDDGVVLTEEDVDLFVANNGFLTSVPPVHWGDVQSMPPGFADGIDNDTVLSEGDVDAFVANNGFLTSVPAQSWASLTGVPPDFADGTDDVLSESDVDLYVANNGYLTDTSDVDWQQLSNVPAGFADDVDNVLSESEVDAFVANNGYLTSVPAQSWASLTGVPPDFADGIDDVLSESEVDAFVANNGYLTDTSNLSWGRLTGVPAGFADGVDNDTVLTETDVDAMVADNGYLTSVPPQAWSSLTGVPAGFADGTDNDALGGLSCANGQAPVRSGGAWTCGTVGDITSVTAGIGLSGGGTSGDVTLDVVFAGSGTANTVARSDHEYQRYQRDNAVETVQPLSSVRYHLSLTAQNYAGSTRLIPQDVIEGLCGDPDGCEFRIGMTRWGGVETETASRGPYLLYYSIPDGRWRMSADNNGVDGNGNTQHILNVWDTCFFTDGPYSSYSGGTDSSRGLYLLVWNGYGNAMRTCELTIDE